MNPIINKLEKEINKKEDAMNMNKQTGDGMHINTVNDVALEDNVILNKHKGKYVGFSNINDYKFQPQIFNNMSLFEWIQTAVC